MPKTRKRYDRWHDGILAALDILVMYQGMRDTPEYRAIRSACTNDTDLRAACVSEGFGALERHGFVEGERDA